MSTSHKSSLSIPDFWKLVAQSGLYSTDECRKLHSLYRDHHQGHPPDQVQPLAQWLVSRKAVSRYQAKVLLAGRAGPFLYGDYRVQDRIGEGRWHGCFRALHVPTKHAVVLQFLTGPLVQDPAQWAVATQWLSALCQVRHPNV